MSDPASKVEIDDVLSSIRRLVAEDFVPEEDKDQGKDERAATKSDEERLLETILDAETEVTQEAGVETDALVLTPSLRVASAVEENSGTTWQAITSESVVDGEAEMLVLHNMTQSTMGAASAYSADLPFVPTAGRTETPRDEEKPNTMEPEMVAEPSETAKLRARIAELEAAILAARQGIETGVDDFSAAADVAQPEITTNEKAVVELPEDVVTEDAAPEDEEAASELETASAEFSEDAAQKFDNFADSAEGVSEIEEFALDDADMQAVQALYEDGPDTEVFLHEQDAATPTDSTTATEESDDVIPSGADLVEETGDLIDTDPQLDADDGGPEVAYEPAAQNADAEDLAVDADADYAAMIEDDADPQDDAEIDFSDMPAEAYDDAFTLDEETVRAMIAEIMHEELQGVLGERITRNVRKLVRREIHFALAAQSLE